MDDMLGLLVFCFLMVFIGTLFWKAWLPAMTRAFGEMNEMVVVGDSDT
jgi:hypothetical protein